MEIDDLSKTTHDPLLAQMRNRLRKEHGAAREGKKIGVACVFSREAVMAPDASRAIECAETVGGEILMRQREHAPHYGLCFVQVTTHVPEAPHRSDKPHCEPAVVRDRPVCRGS